MAQVNIDISETGEVKLAAQQVAGPSCQQLTRAIEDALGRVAGDVKTPDFYRHAANQQTQSGGANAEHRR